jgi:transposase
MLYVLGSDVSKRKVDVSFVNEQGVEQWADNIPNGVAELATYLLTLAGTYPDDEVQCVVEATSCYHHPVLEACQIAGLPCRVYNPLLTRQQIRATVRGKKTDRTDALMVARLGLRGEGRIHTPEPYLATKYYARSQQRFTEFSTNLKRYGTHLNAVLEVDVAHDMLTGIQAQLSAVRRQCIQDAATNAPPELLRRLQTVPGVGPYIAASLIGEVQDMRRFTTAKAFVAYAGLDPKIKQSGHTLNYTGSLTKRGSAYLRRSLFLAACSARQCDPYFRALYDKKRAEGKSYTVAVVVVARKLATVIRAVWLSGTSYAVNFDKTATITLKDVCADGVA